MSGFLKKTIAAVGTCASVLAANHERPAPRGPAPEHLRMSEEVDLGRSPGGERPWCLEVFAGSMGLTRAFAVRGPTVLEPRGVLLGHDLRKRAEREVLYRNNEDMKPQLVWIAFPCRLWGSWTAVNYAGRPEEL